MAKITKGGIPNDRQATPMFTDGKMNGPVGGPTDPPAVPDPMRYLTSPGVDAPGGSPSDSVSIPANYAPSSHHGRTK